MKAPFSPGDVVVCVVKKVPSSPFILGGKYVVRECVYTGMPLFGVKFYDARDPNRARTTGYWKAECFRLYEPPKPEVKTTDRVKELTK